MGVEVAVAEFVDGGVAVAGEEVGGYPVRGVDAGEVGGVWEEGVAGGREGVGECGGGEGEEGEGEGGEEGGKHHFGMGREVNCGA